MTPLHRRDEELVSWSSSHQASRICAFSPSPSHLPFYCCTYLARGLLLVNGSSPNSPTFAAGLKFSSEKFATAFSSEYPSLFPTILFACSSCKQSFQDSKELLHKYPFSHKTKPSGVSTIHTDKRLFVSQDVQSEARRPCWWLDRRHQGS